MLFQGHFSNGTSKLPRYLLTDGEKAFKEVPKTDYFDRGYGEIRLCIESRILLKLN